MKGWDKRMTTNSKEAWAIDPVLSKQGNKQTISILNPFKLKKWNNDFIWRHSNDFTMRVGKVYRGHEKPVGCQKCYKLWSSGYKGIYAHMHTHRDAHNTHTCAHWIYLKLYIYFVSTLCIYIFLEKKKVRKKRGNEHKITLNLLAEEQNVLTKWNQIFV